MLNCLRGLLAALAVFVVGTGCTTTSITNLTPSDLPRSNSGLYRVEAAWQSNQKSIIEDTIEPVVIIGETPFPMQPVPFAKDRWETMVPVPGDQNEVHYRFKFNYNYAASPQRVANSIRSEEFTLEITPNP